MKQWYESSDNIRGIPLTQYVASWYRAGCDGYSNYRRAIQWLQSLNINGASLSDAEIKTIAECIDNGKLELEESAKNFSEFNLK